MAEFLLSTLHSTQLEKVIKQLESKSYFRLQQTCKPMEEFVRTHKGIKGIRVMQLVELVWEKHEDGSLELTCEREKPIKHLYGVRFEHLRPPPEASLFQELCDSLKEHRITAKRLSMQLRDYNCYYDPHIQYTKEQCLTLLKVLKPKSVFLESTDSDRIESLVPIKQMKKLYIYVDPAQLLPAVKEFLPRLHRMHIRTDTLCTAEQIFDLFIPGLKLLRSLFPLPNLEFFELRVKRDSPAPPVEEVMNKLCNFNPTVKDIYNSRRFPASQIYDLKCPLGPVGHCDVNMDDHYAHIYFKSVAYQEKINRYDESMGYVSYEEEIQYDE